MAFREKYRIDETTESFPEMVSEDRYLIAMSVGMNIIEAREKIKESDEYALNMAIELGAQYSLSLDE